MPPAAPHEPLRDRPAPLAAIGGHPIHAMLVHFPIALFCAVLVTDIAYWRTASMMWESFSIWLLTGGLVMGGFADLALLIDFVASRRIRAMGIAWLYLIGNAAVFFLSLVNAFVHSRDGYTSVVPTGLALSAVVVVMVIATAWIGGQMVFRHGVGVDR